jgi:hypothetical protein
MRTYRACKSMAGSGALDLVILILFFSKTAIEASGPPNDSGQKSAFSIENEAYKTSTSIVSAFPLWSVRQSVLSSGVCHLISDIGYTVPLSCGLWLTSKVGRVQCKMSHSIGTERSGPSRCTATFIYRACYCRIPWGVHWSISALSLHRQWSHCRCFQGSDAGFESHH